MKRFSIFNLDLDLNPVRDRSIFNVHLSIVLLLALFNVHNAQCSTANAQCSTLNVQWINVLQYQADTGTDVVCGRWWGSEMRSNFHRLPDRAQKEVRSAVWGLSKQSAGLSIKFHSNAPVIRVRYRVTGGLNMFHMPTTGVSGLDLYATDGNGQLRWCASRFDLSFKDTINYEFRHLTYFTGERRGYDYELFLPLYNEVSWLEIGADEGYDLRLLPVTREAPIVVYGTSIGQGACASRTGMAWTNIVKRETGFPLINLAFSGNGMLEPEVFRYLCEIDARLYVLDCLPNLTEEKVPLIFDRLIRGVEMLRAEHPDTPILLVEHHYANASSSQRAIDRYANSNREQRRAYDTLCQRGVTGIYYLSHDELAFTQESMVEGIHPNDIGMRQYADAYIRKIWQIFGDSECADSPLFWPRTQQRDPYSWLQRHEQVLQRNCDEAPQIVMIGNSITHYWTDATRSPEDTKAYRSSWDRLFKGRIVHNLGFGFDRIENGLWRVIHGELSGYSADKVFLLLGTNNLSTNTDEEIVDGMLMLIRAVRRYQPTARIYQCGIMPRHDQLQRVAHINALLKEKINQLSTLSSPLGGVRGGFSIQFVDLSPGFLDSDGHLIESLFSDGLHPNARGYEIEARNLEKYVKE